MEQAQNLGKKNPKPIQHSLNLFLRASSIVGCLYKIIFLDSAAVAALLCPVGAPGQPGARQMLLG